MVDTRNQSLLAMYAKRPESGRVKSRLAEGIGADAAARFYQRMLDLLVARFAPCEEAHGFTFHLHVDPAESVSWFEERYPAMKGRVFAQVPHVDLGERMLSSFDLAFGQGYEQVALCCSDAPHLAPRHAAEGFSRLATHDAVFGPATDGGYYLIGWRRRLPELFAGMQWSNASVLAESLRRSIAHKISISMLDPLLDIDHASDLDALSDEERHDLLSTVPS